MVDFWDFEKCELCFALLDPSDKIAHEEWHRDRGEEMPSDSIVPGLLELGGSVWNAFQERRARKRGWPLAKP